MEWTWDSDVKYNRVRTWRSGDLMGSYLMDSTQFNMTPQRWHSNDIAVHAPNVVIHNTVQAVMRLSRLFPVFRRCYG